MSSRSNSSVTGLRPRKRSPSGSRRGREPRAERSSRWRRPRALMFTLDGEVARRRVALETLAPALPELLQIEVRVARERLAGRRERLDARDAEHAHLALDAPDQVPGVDLHDQRVRLDAVVAMLAIAALVADVDAFVLPDAACAADPGTAKRRASGTTASCRTATGRARAARAADESTAPPPRACRAPSAPASPARSRPIDDGTRDQRERLRLA